MWEEEQETDNEDAISIISTRTRAALLEKGIQEVLVVKVRVSQEKKAG